MHFEIIGFDKKMDMSKGVFFYKTPISFFDFIDLNQPEFYFMLEIELFIERYYDLMMRDELLQIINQDDFFDIIVTYDG